MLLEGNRSSVYVVVEGKALRRNVTLGRRGSGRVVVRDGVQAGELVVTTGLQKIFFPGMPVQVRNQQAPAEQGAKTEDQGSAPEQAEGE